MEDNNNLAPEEGEQTKIDGDVLAVGENGTLEKIEPGNNGDVLTLVDGMPKFAAPPTEAGAVLAHNENEEFAVIPAEPVKEDDMEMDGEKQGGCGCECASCANCEMAEDCGQKKEVEAIEAAEDNEKVEEAKIEVSLSPDSQAFEENISSAAEAAKFAFDILSQGYETLEEATKILKDTVKGYTLYEDTLNEEKITFEACLVEKLSEGKWSIRIIKEGWSLNKRYYPADMLQRDKGKFEKRPIAMYGWFPESKNLPHVPPSVRNSVPGLVLNEVGWVENVREETESGKLQIMGDFICVDDTLNGRLNNIWNINRSKMPGFSIDAIGDVAIGEAEGRRGLIVHAITYGNEVTLVTNPAAGGSFRTKLVASLSDDFDFELEQISDSNEDRRENMDEKDNVQENELLGEINKLKEAMAEQAKKMEEANKAARLAESRAVLATRLKESGLNEKACSVLRAQFDGKEFSEAELDAQITVVRELLASVDRGGEAQVAQPRVQHVSDPKERMEAALELCFGFDPNKDSGISEAKKDMYRSIGNPSFLAIYKSWCDDESLNFRVGPNAIQEQLSSDLPTTMGNTLGRVVVQQYASLPELWRPFVTVNTQVDQIKPQTRIFHSGLGSLGTVTESTSTDQYGPIGDFTEDSIQYTVGQRGGLYTITRQMLINDDLNTLQKLPKKMARLASKELHEYVFGMVIGNKGGGGIGTDNAYDGVDFYHANHFNLGSSALSHTSLLAAMNALSSQYEYGVKTTVTDNPLSNSATTINLASTVGLKANGIIVIEAEKIQIGAVASATQLTGCTRGVLGTTAASHASGTRVDQMHASLELLDYHLIVPKGTDVAEMAWRLLGTQEITGTANHGASIVARNNPFGSRITLHDIPVTYLGNDTNNWYLTAMPSQIDVFELAFLFNRQVPETWLQDNPIVGNVFLRDNFTYKLRHEYGGTCLDWRGAYASIVSG